jgi:signal transduction histidine kinase
LGLVDGRPRYVTALGETDTPDGKQAIIRVRDSGIAADQLPRIFDMFTQVDTSLERSQSGLGVG